MNMDDLCEKALSRVTDWAKHPEFQDAIEQFLEAQRDPAVARFRSDARRLSKAHMNNQQKEALYDELNVAVLSTIKFSKRMIRAAQSLSEPVERFEQKLSRGAAESESRRRNIVAPHAS
jgi:hypothetical protein